MMHAFHRGLESTWESFVQYVDHARLRSIDIRYLLLAGHPLMWFL